MKLRKNLVNLTYFCTAMSLNVSIWRISRDDFNLFFSDRGWYNIDFRSSYQSEYQRRLESSDPLYDSYPNAHVLHYHPQHPYRRSGRSWTQKLGAKKEADANFIQMMSPTQRVWFLQRYTKKCHFYIVIQNWLIFKENRIINQKIQFLQF